MKRLLFAFTVLAMLVTSCAKDATTMPVVEGETVVSFKVSSPKMQTRYGEGTTANKLLFAVYQNDNLMPNISALTLDEAVDINLTADVKIPLVKGLTYNILFWAQNEEAPYTFDGKKVTIDYANLAANEEAYDAFFRNFEVHIENSTPHYVELYRPFAQLNIGTGDLAEAIDAGFELKKTSITVETCTVLNLEDGKAEQPQEMTFDLNTKAEDTYEGFDIISMNYLLVNSEKELINVTFNAEGTNNNIINNIERDYVNVPIQRNHKTYMLGDILTTPSLFNVVIIPAFDGILPETAEEKLLMAAQMGGEFTLEEDITVNAPVVVTKDFVLNLNGKTLTNKAENTEVDVIVVEEGATLTINGEGNVKAVSGNDGYAVFANGTVIINGGTFESGYDTKGLTNAVIYVRGKGKAYINGGKFLSDNTARHTINKKDADRATTTIEVKGGTFQNFNPADNAAEGAGTNFLAEGHSSVADGDYFVVVPLSGVTAVADDHAEIRSAIKEKDAVVYVFPTEDGSSYKLEGKLSMGEGVSLIGAGDEPVALFNDWGSNAFANQAHFTNTHIENVYFSNNLVIDAGIANGNVTFKGCVFGGDLAHQGVHFDSGTGVITFDDCTFVGRNMFGSSLEKVIFNNCKFENKKSSQTGPDKWTGVNMWGKYEFNNCEFDTEATCNVKCNGVEADFNNCFYSNGKNIKEVVKNSPAYTCTIKFDGVKAASTVATTSAALNAAIAAGHTTIGLAAGDYKMPVGTDVNLQGKTLTIVGTKDVVIDASAIDARDQFVIGATLSFEGVTLNFGKNIYMGFANCSSLTYKDCDINGLQFLYGGPAKFENCKFNSNGAEHSVWTYGSSEISFDGCEFTYGDRCVNVYVDNGTGSVDVDFNNCKFSTDNAASAGAIEINASAFPLGASVDFSGCTAPAIGHMVFISKWDPSVGATASVTIDGATYNAPVQQ